MKPDSYISARRRMTAEEFAHVDSTFLWYDAVGNEAAELLNAIIAAKGLALLKMELSDEAIDAIARHEIPVDYTDRVLEILHAAAAQVGAQLVKPATTRLPRESQSITQRDVTVLATGDRVRADDPRIADIRQHVSTMSLDDADELRKLLANLASKG